MALGFGSIKDIARALTGPGWLVAGAIAFFLLCAGISLIRSCG